MDEPPFYLPMIKEFLFSRLRQVIGLYINQQGALSFWIHGFFLDCWNL